MKTVLQALFCGLYFCLSAQSNFELLSNLPTYGHPANDVWGYTAPDGGKYAIVGTEGGTAFFDITNPREAVPIKFFSGQHSTWRDIKTWGDYAYVVNDSGGGMDIFYLGNLPDEIEKYNWDGDANFDFNRAHNLWIDEEGYGYLTSFNGVEIIDLFSDPQNPKYVGLAPGPESHDMHVRDDRLYTFNLFEGMFRIYDVIDKENAILLASQTTPNFFTHSGWLSDDGNVLFTCDERVGAFTTAFDVFNPQDIRELDRYRPLERANVESVPHNAFVHDDFLFISHYSDGCILLDAHQPDNLIQVGQYDTFEDDCEHKFDGAWGVYVFPEGEPVLVSDRSTGLYVLQPTYQRACYLEGQVVDGKNGLPIFGAVVEMSDNEETRTETDLSGEFKTGQVEPGVFELVVKRPGYFEERINVELSNGETASLTVELEPLAYPQSVKVLDKKTRSPLAEAAVSVENENQFHEGMTDHEGLFEFPENWEGDFVIHIGKWGWRQTSVFPSEDFFGGEIEIELERGYEDNFESDMGWEVSGDAIRGHWERTAPSDSTAGFCKESLVPLNDWESDWGEKCFVTGKGEVHFPGAFWGGYEEYVPHQVDSGTTILHSPIMEVVSTFREPELSYSTWFQNDDLFIRQFYTSPLDYPILAAQYIPTEIVNDSLSVYIDNGKERVLLEALTEPHEWRRSSVFKIREHIELTDEMRVIFRTSDQAETPNIVEAAIDHFLIAEGADEGAFTEGNDMVGYRYFPNPFYGEMKIEYELVKGAVGAKLLIFNYLGQLVNGVEINPGFGVLSVGNDFPTGTYFGVFQVDGK